MGKLLVDIVVHLVMSIYIVSDNYWSGKILQVALKLPHIGTVGLLKKRTMKQDEQACYLTNLFSCELGYCWNKNYSKHDFNTSMAHFHFKNKNKTIAITSFECSSPTSIFTQNAFLPSLYLYLNSCFIRSPNFISWVCNLYIYDSNKTTTYYFF